MGPACTQGVSHSVRIIVGNSQMKAHMQARTLSQSQQQLESKHRHDRYAANTSGLSSQSQALLTDMRDNNSQDQTFSLGDDMTALQADDTLQWETIPDDLQEDETFIHAVRDIVGSQ
ncbi:hypothetical protein BDR07DRAFT_1386105 [Suillus spraguei]|nr:hypothetical protein BDR07DRAFT_1386105 [Suillus spraguei]